MPFSILGFGASLNSATLVNLPPITDPTFVLQNAGTAFRFFRDYDMTGAYIGGATIAQAQFNNATWNSINPSQIYPVALTLAVPSNPQVADYRYFPVGVPRNEDFQLQVANAGGGAERDMGLVWIRPRGHVPRMPAAPSPPGGLGNMGRVKIRFTVTAAITQLVWTADQAITIAQTLRGGTYLICGMQLICATGIAFRVNFPNSVTNGGDKLYPGDLCSATYGNVPLVWRPDWQGPYGYFDTNSYFQIAILAGTTAGSTTYQGWIDALWMGTPTMGEAGAPKQQDLLMAA